MSRLMNLSIFSVLIPSRSYPTLMLKRVPMGRPAEERSVCSTCTSSQAFRYSSYAWSRLSSVDHSTL